VPAYLVELDGRVNGVEIAGRAAYFSSERQIEGTGIRHLCATSSRPKLKILPDVRSGIVDPTSIEEVSRSVPYLIDALFAESTAVRAFPVTSDATSLRCFTFFVEQLFEKRVVLRGLRPARHDWPSAKWVRMTSTRWYWWPVVEAESDVVENKKFGAHRKASAAA